MQNTVFGALINVSLVDGLGNPLSLYLHRGRYYVEAVDGLEYKIIVDSNSNRRLEVLTAIDGRNTLVDEVADVVRNRGMVISSHDRYDVKGWRLNDDQVRSFVFTTNADMTVGKQATGSEANLGVVAVAAYAEKVEPQICLFSGRYLGDAKGSLEIESTTTSFRGSVGTGMGSRVESDHVGRTSFTRDLMFPYTKIEIFAMSHQWLVDHEIIREEGNLPVAFPGGDTGYDKYKKI